LSSINNITEKFHHSSFDYLPYNSEYYTTLPVYCAYILLYLSVSHTILSSSNSYSFDEWIYALTLWLCKELYTQKPYVYSILALCFNPKVILKLFAVRCFVCMVQGSVENILYFTCVAIAISSAVKKYNFLYAVLLDKLMKRTIINSNSTVVSTKKFIPTFAIGKSVILILNSDI
jgi:hypothetical protein